MYGEAGQTACPALDAGGCVNIIPLWRGVDSPQAKTGCVNINSPLERGGFAAGEDGVCFMNSKILTYNPSLKEKAKKLRKQGVLSEVLLWNELKGKKLLGFDFHRQKPIDIYIVDFYCNELRLAIEIDGDSHNYKIEYDKKRENKLKNLGITILKYYDGAVKQNVFEIVEDIKKWINEHEK